MPSASEELRRLWLGPEPDYAEGYLGNRGYELDDDYDWRHPEPDWVPSERDFSAMQFMADEWDYGWFKPHEPLAVEYENCEDELLAFKSEYPRLRSRLFALEAQVKSLEFDIYEAYLQALGYTPEDTSVTHAREHLRAAILNNRVDAAVAKERVQNLELVLRRVKYDINAHHLTARTLKGVMSMVGLRKSDSE